jgi:uncharacterized protein (TIGR02217 family)
MFPSHQRATGSTRKTIIRITRDVSGDGVTRHVCAALGVEVTADVEFEVPVRFDTDHMAVTIETYQLHNWQQIPIVELRS